MPTFGKVAGIGQSSGVEQVGAGLGIIFGVAHEANTTNREVLNNFKRASDEWVSARPEGIVDCRGVE